MKTYQLTLAGVLDYGRSFTKWLAGDTIDNVTWVIGTGLAIVSQGLTGDTPWAFLRVDGAQIKDTIYCTVRVHTVGGRTEERSFRIKIVEYKS